MAVVTGGAEAGAAGISVTTGAVNMTGMKALVVGISNFTNTGAIHDGTTPVTDSSGNTWTKIGQGFNKSSSASGYMELFYVNSASPTVSASQTFTFTGSSASDFPAIVVIGWDGAGSASPLDIGDSAHIALASPATTVATPAATTTQASELLVSVFAGGPGGSAVSVASSGSTSTTWTKDQDFTSSGGQPIALAHSVVSATGTYAGTWTAPSGNLMAGIATIKAAGVSYDPSVSRFPDDYGVTDAGMLMQFMDLRGY